MLATGNATADTTLDQYRSIVVAKNASQTAKEAAGELQYHLQKIAGRAFPVVENTSGQDGLHFFVGGGTSAGHDEEIAKLPVEGWLIRSVDNGILLASEEKGTSPKTPSGYHSVPLFLEKYCRVRWVWPGKTGEVIPHNPQLALPNLNDVGKPAMKRRQFLHSYNGLNSKESQIEFDQWSKRARLGNQINANFGHAWESVLPHAMYFDKHPEWYGEVNGKRTPAQLCTANREMRDEFVKRLLSLPGNQKLDIISVSANDGYGFCECSLCKAKGDIGDAYWDFVNDIATRVQKLRPDVGIGTFAYSYSRNPPAKIKRLPNNIYLSMQVQASSLMTPEGRETYDKYIQGWSTKGVNIVMREYWGVHYWLDLPILFPEEIATALKTATTAGMIGAYGETSKSWATQGPNTYMTTHLLWDPTADPKTILDDFYSAFGPAEPAVRAYYQFLRDALHREGETFSKLPYAGRLEFYGKLFNPTLMAQAARHLDEAEHLAGNDEELKARLTVLRAGCEYTTVLAELFDTYAKLGRTGFPLEFFEWETTAATRRKALNTIDVADESDDLPYFNQRQDEPFPFTLAQKDAWLQKAWELGEKRTQLLNKYRHLPALNEGLYAMTQITPNRNWHQTVTRFLGKKEEDVTPLIFTPRPVKTD